MAVYKFYILKIAMERDEDGGWAVWVPDLPGCATQGDTKEEALVNMQEALELYIKDMLEAGESLPSKLQEEPALAVKGIPKEGLVFDVQLVGDDKARVVMVT